MEKKILRYLKEQFTSYNLGLLTSYLQQNSLFYYTDQAKYQHQSQTPHQGEINSKNSSRENPGFLQNNTKIQWNIAASSGPVFEIFH